MITEFTFHITALSLSVFARASQTKKGVFQLTLSRNTLLLEKHKKAASRRSLCVVVFCQASMLWLMLLLQAVSFGFAFVLAWLRFLLA